MLSLIALTEMLMSGFIRRVNLDQKETEKENQKATEETNVVSQTMGQRDVIRKHEGENKSMVRVRGFEIISDYDELPKEERPILPRRQTKQSAGYDFYAVGDVLIPKGWGGMIHTGVKAYMPPDEHLEVFIRSSYGMRYGMRLANGTGIIDADYYNNPDNEGEILIKLINDGDGDIMIRRGDRFAQGIFVKHYLIDNDDADGDRVGGVGSTK